MVLFWPNVFQLCLLLVLSTLFFALKLLKRHLSFFHCPLSMSGVFSVFTQLIKAGHVKTSGLSLPFLSLSRRLCRNCWTCTSTTTTITRVDKWYWLRHDSFECTVLAAQTQECLMVPCLKFCKQGCTEKCRLKYRERKKDKKPHK